MNMMHIYWSWDKEIIVKYPTFWFLDVPVLVVHLVYAENIIRLGIPRQSIGSADRMYLYKGGGGGGAGAGEKQR